MVWGLSDYGRCVFGSGVPLQGHPLLPPSVTTLIIQAPPIGDDHPNPYGLCLVTHPHPRVRMMIRIAEIDHVVLRVIDIDAMQRFYCDVLGCCEERRQDEIGLVQLRAGSSLIDLVPVDGKLGRHGGAAPGSEGHNMDHLCLRVEDYDEAAILAHLKAHGARIGELGSRYGAHGEGPSIYLYDPQGNMIELKGPPAV